MAKTTVIKHLTGVNYVKLMQDYIEICGYVSEKTGVIKTNDCAAALLNFYEHRHNSIIESHGESKKPINLFQESGLGFLEKVLLFHYSQKSIKEANAFLEIKGYIEIRRSRISETENAPNEVLLLVDNVNFALNEYDKIRGDKNYRTLILPHPSDKITPPPPVKLPHPSTNFTESKDNTNDNSNYNQEKEPLTPFSNGKNKPKTKCEAQPIPTGLDTPDFVEAWAQLLETKKWRTKEVSAINLALKKLSAYDVVFAIQLVETAIMGGYQSAVFSDTPTAYEKWQKTKQTSSQTFQQPHPNFPNRPLYVNSFADKWAKVKWWRTNLAELENGQDKEYSFTEISKMLQYTEPLNILK